MGNRYKLYNLAKGDNKNGKSSDLDKIEELKEYIFLMESKVYGGVKYVYDRCEIL